MDFSSIEFAQLAEEHDFSDEATAAVSQVFDYLKQKKVETTIHTLLKLSRFPLKDPKTFENFDFSVIKGWDAERLKALTSLSLSAPTRIWHSLALLEQVKPIWHRPLAMSAVSVELKPPSLKCPSCGTNLLQPEEPVKRLPFSTDWYGHPARLLMR